MAHIQTTRLNLRQTFTGNTLWSIGIVIVDFTAIALILSRTVADPDLWGHLRFGLDIIQAGTIIQVDPYSYLTTGQRWINHEWLAEVLFALAWTAGREPGLILLKMTVGFLTIAILYRHLRAMQLRHMQATILLLLMGFILVVQFYSVIRPQIFTFLFFALILLIIRRADIGEYRWLWAAPLLLILWVNLHGGVPCGPGSSMSLGAIASCRLQARIGANHPTNPHQYDRHISQPLWHRFTDLFASDCYRATA
jgi:hypothetical protein